MALSKVMKLVGIFGAFSMLSQCIDGDFGVFVDESERSSGYVAEGIPGFSGGGFGDFFSSEPAPLDPVVVDPVPTVPVDAGTAATQTVPVDDAVEIFI